MEYASITKKGQVTISLKFRDILGIRSGEKVIFDIEEEKVVLKKVQIDPVSDIVCPGKGIFGTGMAYQRKIRSEWDENENLRLNMQLHTSTKSAKWQAHG